MPIKLIPVTCPLCGKTMSTVKEATAHMTSDDAHSERVASIFVDLMARSPVFGGTPSTPTERPHVPTHAADARPERQAGDR